MDPEEFTIWVNRSKAMGNAQWRAQCNSKLIALKTKLAEQMEDMQKKLKERHAGADDFKRQLIKSVISGTQDLDGVEAAITTGVNDIKSLGYGINLAWTRQVVCGVMLEAVENQDEDNFLKALQFWQRPDDQVLYAKHMNAPQGVFATAWNWLWS